VLKKKVWANFQRVKELVPKKLSLSSQKYGFGIRDPRSWIRKKPIPDPGVKKAPDPGSATLLQRLRTESVRIPGNVGAGRLQAGKLALQVM
jgi:hypothetical protein